MPKVKKDFSTLLDFICAWDFDDKEDKLFAISNDLLKKNWQATSFVVLSYPEKIKDMKKIDRFKSIRVLYNKTEYEKNFKDDIVKTVINEEIPEDKKFYHHKDGEKNYYFYRYGEDSNQINVGLFITEGESITDEAALSYFVTLSKQIMKHIWKVRVLQKASSLIHTDDVTELYNQRRLFKDLDECIKKYEKFGEGFVVLFIDIDHFKNVNDGHGHLIGTMLLSEMAKIFQRVLRESDLVYRYGGDEFVMIVPNADTDVARLIGERILRAVKDHDFIIHNHELFKLSVSIGIAEYPRDAKTSNDILAMADQMMYRAKSGGRGKVCLAGELFG